jgi:UDP-glucose 4-epimerase
MARPHSIVVTGAAGFIGSHVAHSLAARGERVLGCDNFITGSRARIPAGIEFEEADCRDLQAMNRICAGARVVVHCAATAYEGLSVYSPHFVGEHVFGASSAVFSASANQAVSRIVFVSSMARYGDAPVPFVESQPPQPVDPYGVAKVAAEMMLSSLSRLHGLEHVIAVPHNVVGAGQRYDDVYRNVAAIMINRVLSGTDPIIYGDGSQQRCFTHIADVAEQLVALTHAPDVDGEVYNLGGGTELISIDELARRICDRVGWRFRPIRLPARHGEVHSATCSHAKITRKLGFVARRSLDEALDDLIAEIRAAGPRELLPGIALEIDAPTIPDPWLTVEERARRSPRSA